MGKRKRSSSNIIDETSTEDETATYTDIKTTTTTSSEQKKRKVGALNFSIESIMSSSGPTIETNVGSPQSSIDVSPAPELPAYESEEEDGEGAEEEEEVASLSGSFQSKNQSTSGTSSGDLSSSSSRLSGIQCQLDNKDVWDKFHSLNTEMIITKQGRRMFPPVRVTFSISLSAEQALLSQNPRDKYQVLMDISPYDGKRYRYAYHKSSWQQAGKADPPSPTKLFLHPDGPFTLEQLKRQVISFEKIKLTNNDANKHGYILLNSMHKYQPRIHLVLWRGKESQSLANAPITQLEQEIHKTFIFSETIFTAVTAYQNHSITKLKIDSNPFAKGFRDSSRLTDLEIESMQDLMSEGQCPFSPPRAPPHGFPHFLFAAAQQAAAAAGSIEDPASTLLRERTIMALDSFLQQQQQQQQYIQSASPNRPGPPPYSQAAAPNSQQSSHQQLAINHPPPYPGIPFASFLNNTQQQQQQPSSAPPPGNPQQVPANLEQLIMQQQQQFAAAAAMAAAAAAHNHPLHNLFTAASGQHMTNKQSPSAVSTSQQQQQQSNVKLASNRAGNQSCSPIQLSPNFAPASTKSPTSAPQTHHHNHQHSQNGQQSPSFQLNGLPQGGAQSATPYYAFHPQHIHAMMAAHHQHQMAAQMAQMHQQLEQSAATNRQLVVGLPQQHINQESGNQQSHHHDHHHQQQHLQLGSSGGISVTVGNMSGSVQAGKKNL